MKDDNPIILEYDIANQLLALIDIFRKINKKKKPKNNIRDRGDSQFCTDRKC